MPLSWIHIHCRVNRSRCQCGKTQFISQLSTLPHSVIDDLAYKQMLSLTFTHYHFQCQGNDFWWSNYRMTHSAANDAELTVDTLPHSSMDDLWLVINDLHPFKSSTISFIVGIHLCLCTLFLMWYNNQNYSKRSSLFF